jgi:ribosomal-protein-alanine N-acetyltransferase
MYRIYRDPKVMRYTPSGPAESIDRTRLVIDYFIGHESQHGFSIWAAIEKASERIIGHAGLFLSEGRGPEVEVVFCLGRDFWGRGYATEAATASLHFGLAGLGLDRIIGLTFPANFASRRVLEKIGMAPAGRLHRYGHDLLLYAVEKPPGSPCT